MEKICNKCGLVKSKFKGKKCWDCAKAYERERRKRKRESNQFIECKICATIKHSSEMSTSLSRTCKECVKIMNDNNARIINLNNLLSNETKICKHCNITKHVSEYGAYSRICAKCKNEISLNRRRIKSLENELSTEVCKCNYCNQIKPVREFSPYFKTCKKCKNKKYKRS